MSATTKDRNTPVMGAGFTKASYPVAASTVINKGTMVSILNSSGFAEPSFTHSTTQQVVGMSLTHVDNSTGANGDLSVEVQTVIARWVNGSSITEASVGLNAYATDDQTVNGSSNAALAGPIVQVDSTGVWVRTGVL